MADSWQPIETAPKDGTKVDLWVVSEHRAKGERCTAFWAREPFSFASKRESWRGIPHNPMNWKPTHWMPFPDPPSMKDEGHG